MRKSRQLLVAGQALAFVALCVTAAGCGPKKPPASAGTGTKQAAQAITEVAALARLAPKDDIRELAAPTADVLQELSVEVGDSVKQGQVLGHLQQYTRLKASRDLAKRRLDQAQQSLNADLDHAKAELSEATARLAQYQKPPELELASQEAQIRRLKAELALAQWNVDRLRNLSLNASVSEQEFKQKETDAISLEEQLDGAQKDAERMKLMQAINSSIGAATVATAQAALDQTTRASKVPILEAELAEADAHLEQAVLRAPIDGEILRIMKRAGEGVDPTAPILCMGNTKTMYAVAEVYESLVRYVEPGQTVTIASPAFAEPLAGVVERVGLEAYKQEADDNDPSTPNDARVVQVWVKLNDSTAARRFSRLPVQARIQVKP